MTNYCRNRITFQGIPETIQKLINVLEVEKEPGVDSSKVIGFDPNTILPMTGGEGDYEEDYDETTRHGVGWAGLDGWRLIGDTILELGVTSSWDPIMELVEYLSIRFPELVAKLYYYDPTEEFGWYVGYSAGKVFESHYYSYEKSMSDYLDFLDRDLNNVPGWEKYEAKDSE